MKQSESTAPVAAEHARPKSLRLIEAKALRRALKADLAPTLADARNETGLHQSQLAAEIGVDQSHVGRWELDHQIEAPNVLAIASAAGASAQARSVGLAALRWTASKYAALVVEHVRDRHGDRHLERLASVTREVSEAQCTVTSALADNDTSDVELEAIGRESREAAEALIEQAAYAQRELAKRRAAR